jgi:peptidyl-prolyl cis-trans isomerase D
MFATIRRHQSWLWGIIITVIIISFVIFFSPNVNLDSRRSANFGSINGRPITLEEFTKVYYEAQLRYYFSYGSWPDAASKQTGFDTEREARNRMVLVRKMQDLDIHVSEKAAARWLASVPFFQDRRERKFREENYDRFLKLIAQDKRLQERDLERFAMNEVGIQQLIALFGLPGKLVTPREAEVLYRREHEELATEVALFPATNYLASVPVGTNDLNQFFSNRFSVYRIPDRVQVSYVKFEATNFLAEAEQAQAKITNFNQIVNQVYLERGTNFWTDKDGQVLTETAAKEKIRLDNLHEFALQGAHRKAAEFATEVFAITPQKKENLALVAAKKQMPVKDTEPFSQYEGPSELNVLETFVRAAFALSSDEPLTSPIAAEDGFYVIAFKQKIPSSVPPLDSIRAKVTEDYRMFQALRLAEQAGRQFSLTLSNGLAQQKTFSALCAEAKVKTVALPKFSRSTRSLPEVDDQIDLSLVKSLTDDLTPGRASQFVPNRSGGLVVYLASRTPADKIKVQADLPAFLAELRRSQQFEAFSDWLGREIAQSGLSESAPSKAKAN